MIVGLIIYIIGYFFCISIFNAVYFVLLMTIMALQTTNIYRQDTKIEKASFENFCIFTFQSCYFISIFLLVLQMFTVLKM